MAYSPIDNPDLPFNKDISLFPGFLVFVTGKPTGERFAVNFMTEKGDEALHFNPRFDQRRVIRNTKINGTWGTQEGTGEFPFVMNEVFEIGFLCLYNHYKIAVNGKLFTTYKHRVSRDEVSILNIYGDVQISEIRFDKEELLEPSASAVFYSPEPRTPTVISNPIIPYIAEVPFENVTGMRMTVDGVPVNRDPYRLRFDFETAEPNKDIFFHFNPRMKEGEIVRNSSMNQEWGEEEKKLSAPFPFHYDVPYQLVFSVDKDGFRVEVNGTTICTFEHRHKPLHLIRGVNILGSTDVSRITFEQDTATEPQKP